MSKHSHKIRGLTEAEKALWEKVVANAKPIDPPGPEFKVSLGNQATRPLPAPTPIQPFRIGEISPGRKTNGWVLPATGDDRASVSPNMDKRSFERLKKGKLRVDGRIDLHGMTLAQAYPVLNGFVHSAYASDKRLLLVITGKGKPQDDQEIMPARRGILKQQVPAWLSMPPLAALVLQLVQATGKHGGAGAYYVYLKRRR